MIDAIAATGDAGDINCWSGIPWHFGEAARSLGWRATPWRLDLAAHTRARRWWNLRRVLSGRGLGGYQYSEAFLDRAEAEVPDRLWANTVLTFNQHFPRTQSVAARGGRLVHYLDATFASLSRQQGWVDHVSSSAIDEALAVERENLRRSARVVTMARWAAVAAVQEHGLAADNVFTILPGANLELPVDFDFPVVPGQTGVDRPLVLGFVGKDWRRKGLSFLMDVRTQLQRQGLSAVIRCAGHCPRELQREPGVEYTGFIDKSRTPARFVEFLTGCDVGCLFSSHEPLGISTLEFLRAGVPVAGFVCEGVADTIPPDAGFRFEPGTGAEAVAEALGAACRNGEVFPRLRAAARRWSPLVTWERCIKEWGELLKTGRIFAPVQPWRGLPAPALPTVDAGKFV